MKRPIDLCVCCLALVVLTASLGGCAEDEEAAQAKLYIVHQLYTQGPLELFSDGKRIAEIEPNALDLSSAKKIDVGLHHFSMRAKGASVDLNSADLIFGERAYLVGIYQPLQPNSVRTMQLYGEGEPSVIASDKAAVQVVNFLSEQPIDLERRAIVVDVYVNSAKMASNIAYGESTKYIEISAAANSVVQVFRTGESPSSHSPLQMVDAVTGTFDATGGKAFVLTLINTELGVGSTPLVRLAAFALR